jgi:hypothetical protein
LKDFGSPHPKAHEVVQTQRENVMRMVDQDLLPLRAGGMQVSQPPEFKRPDVSLLP